MPADPPVLTRSRGPWRGMGSKVWTPTGAVQRVGALVIGTVFVAGGLTAIVVSPALKGEFQALISSPTIAWVVSLFAVAWALAIASFVIWLGGRLLAGCFRHSPDRKRRT
jgi:hypothetical protein